MSDTSAPVEPPLRAVIVDDDRVLGQYHAALLEDEGFFTTVCHGPLDLLNAYSALAPDLLVIDLHLPDMQGDELIRRIREERGDRETAMLLISAEENTEIIGQALRRGATGFFRKPLDAGLFGASAVSLARNACALKRATQAAKRLAWELQQQNDGLELRVAERTRELEETQLEILRRLGRAAEFRDNETGHHIQRMSRYSRLLAEAAGLPSKQVAMLYAVSPMHDIGKIGIDDALLRKPGKLTAEEFEVVKRHPLIGADLLSGHESPLLRMAQSIALTHHEHWNGGGYPHRLAGEQIPIEGRIVAIADVFDALTSLRPYKRAWKFDEALAYIEAEAGRQFDPQLAQLVRPLRGAFATIHREFFDQH